MASTDLGEPLTLAYRIENHLEAGLSTIEESASRAAALVSCSWTTPVVRTEEGEGGDGLYFGRFTASCVCDASPTHICHAEGQDE